MINIIKRPKKKVKVIKTLKRNLRRNLKINRKTGKLLIGGDYDTDFFSLDLSENFIRPINKKNVFPFEFMKKYIKNVDANKKLLEK